MIAGIATALHVVRAGLGPPVLLVHGSAADHTTWSIQLASAELRARFELIAPDRRADAPSVAAHAEDLAALLVAPALVIGSSFGAVIALELLRTRPALCRGGVLIEPPLAASDAPPATATLLAELDRRAAEAGGPAAAELFLRRALGDAAFERMPRSFRDRASAKWPAIRSDAAALIAYPPRYAELAALAAPCLLVGGARSAAYFRPTLDALAAALPRARLEIVPDAGHMLHAEAPRRFGELVIGFCDELGIG
ncbi:MAG TPA: alpha/beta hydrolase [Kofleriaceae bacterium]|nr:alpha/beta hydrolase [Kofleriaceae bacterium]